MVHLHPQAKVRNIKNEADFDILILNFEIFTNQAKFLARPPIPGLGEIVFASITFLHFPGTLS